MTLHTLCLHGPESTGKSTLAAALGAQLSAPIVAEYGRDWCAQHGADTSMDDLVIIATEHARQIAAAKAAAHAAGRAWLILDTDAVMTAVWAEMLYGHQAPYFQTITPAADLYLVPDLDLPWVADGLRYLGADADRRRFTDLSIRELDRRTLPYVLIRGQGAHRQANALTAIHAHFEPGA